MPLVRSPNPDPHYHEAQVVYVDPSGTEHTLIFDAVISEDWNPTATVTEHPVEQGSNIVDHVRVAPLECTIKIHVSNEPIDSNTFADAHPVPLLLLLPQWQSNLGIATQIGQIAGFASEIAGRVVDQVENQTPIGNLVAAALKPIKTVLQNGNEVTSYDLTQALIVGGQAARTLSDVASNLTFAGISSLAPPGFQTYVNVPTDPVISFDNFTDFAAVMINTLLGLQQKAQLFTVVGSKQTQASMVLEAMPYHRGDVTETGTGAIIELHFKQIRQVSTQVVTAPLAAVPSAQTPIKKGQQDPSDAAPAQANSVSLAIKNGIVANGGAQAIIGKVLGNFFGGL